MASSFDLVKAPFLAGYNLDIKIMYFRLFSPNNTNHLQKSCRTAYGPFDQPINIMQIIFIFFASGRSVGMRMIQILQKVYYAPPCERPAPQHNTDQVHFLCKKLYCCPLCERPARPDVHMNDLFAKKLFDLTIGTGWPIRMIWIIRQESLYRLLYQLAKYCLICKKLCCLNEYHLFIIV